MFLKALKFPTLTYRLGNCEKNRALLCPWPYPFYCHQLAIRLVWCCLLGWARMGWAEIRCGNRDRSTTINLIRLRCKPCAWCVPSREQLTTVRSSSDSVSYLTTGGVGRAYRPPVLYVKQYHVFSLYID